MRSTSHTKPISSDSSQPLGSPFEKNPSIEMTQALFLKLYVMLLEGIETHLLKGDDIALEKISKFLKALQTNSRHAKTRGFMGLLGYRVNFEGMCEGIAMRGLESHLSSQLPILKKRIDFLYLKLTDMTKDPLFMALTQQVTLPEVKEVKTIPAKSIEDAMKRTQHSKAGFLKDALIHVREQLENTKALLNQQLQILTKRSKTPQNPIELSEYLDYVTDLNATFNNVMMYQAPDEYKDVFDTPVSQGAIETISQLSQSLALERKIFAEKAKLKTEEKKATALEKKSTHYADVTQTAGLTHAGRHGGIYTNTNLKALLARMERLALDNGMGDFAFTFRSLDHTITIAYQAPKPPEHTVPAWKIIDGNKLKLLDKELSTDQIADEVCSTDENTTPSSFLKNVEGSSDEFALASKYYTTPQYFKLLKTLVHELKKTKEYRAVVRVTADKVILQKNSQGNVINRKSLAEFATDYAQDTDLLLNIILHYHKQNRKNEVLRMVVDTLVKIIRTTPLKLNLVEAIFSHRDGLGLIDSQDRPAILQKIIFLASSYNLSKDHVQLFHIIVNKGFKLIQPEDQINLLKLSLMNLLGYKISDEHPACVSILLDKAMQIIEEPSVKTALLLDLLIDTVQRSQESDLKRDQIFGIILTHCANLDPSDQLTILKKAMLQILSSQPSSIRNEQLVRMLDQSMLIIKSPELQIELLQTLFKQNFLYTQNKERNELIKSLISHGIRLLSKPNQIALVKELIAKLTRHKIDNNYRNCIKLILNQGLAISNRDEKIALLQFTFAECLKFATDPEKNVLILEVANSCLQLKETAAQKAAELTAQMNVIIGMKANENYTNLLTSFITTHLPMTGDDQTGYELKKEIIKQALFAVVSTMQPEYIESLTKGLALFSAADQKDLLVAALQQAYTMSKSTQRSDLILKLVTLLLPSLLNPADKIAVLDTALKHAPSGSQAETFFSQQKSTAIHELKAATIETEQTETKSAPELPPGKSKLQSHAASPTDDLEPTERSLSDERTRTDSPADLDASAPHSMRAFRQLFQRDTGPSNPTPPTSRTRTDTNQVLAPIVTSVRSNPAEITDFSYPVTGNKRASELRPLRLTPGSTLKQLFQAPAQPFALPTDEKITEAKRQPDQTQHTFKVFKLPQLSQREKLTEPRDASKEKAPSTEPDETMTRFPNPKTDSSAPGTQRRQSLAAIKGKRSGY